MTKPARPTVATVLDIPEQDFLPDAAAYAALATIGTSSSPRAAKGNDARVVRALQRVAREAVQIALNGRRDDGNAAKRGAMIAQAERYLTDARKVLERVADIPGYPPPEVWRGQEWKVLTDWFAAEAKRSRGKGRASTPPARRWAMARLVVLYEVASGRTASAGSGEGRGPCARFVTAWQDGLREVLREMNAKDLAEIVAPRREGTALRREIAEAIKATDNAPTEEAARWPDGLAEAWTPRREVKEWLTGN